MWQGLKDRIMNEPVAMLTLIQAGITMAVGFGLEWSGEQVALVTTFSAAALGFIARKSVTPNNKL